MIKIMKPQDHMTYEMIDIARKTSQQVNYNFILVSSFKKIIKKYSKKSETINKVKKRLNI
jgi:hypothetical protein